MELRLAGYDDPVVAELCAEQQRELQTRYAGTDPVPQIIKPGIEFLVAPDALGCVGLQPLDGEIGEIKRMFVRADHRGRGLSRLLLTGVEDLARQRGLRRLQLETGDRQQEAIGLYTSSGYEPIPLFGPYVGCVESRCFAKNL